MVPCGGAGGGAYRPPSIVAVQGVGFLIVCTSGDAAGGASFGSLWWCRGRGLRPLSSQAVLGGWGS